METTIQTYLASLHLGEAQVYRNITIIPVSTPVGGSPAYVTLGEAVGSGALRVTEISQVGSVPELRVVNRGDNPVLLLDGEEMVGTKQSRALNTRILLREKSETKIPVFCTKHGRWAYQSEIGHRWRRCIHVGVGSRPNHDLAKDHVINYLSLQRRRPAAPGPWSGTLQGDWAAHETPCRKTELQTGVVVGLDFR